MWLLHGKLQPEEINLFAIHHQASKTSITLRSWRKFKLGEVKAGMEVDHMLSFISVCDTIQSTTDAFLICHKRYCSIANSVIFGCQSLSQNGSNSNASIICTH